MTNNLKNIILILGIMLISSISFSQTPDCSGNYNVIPFKFSFKEVTNPGHRSSFRTAYMFEEKLPEYICSHLQQFEGFNRLENDLSKILQDFSNLYEVVDWVDRYNYEKVKPGICPANTVLLGSCDKVDDKIYISVRLVATPSRIDIATCILTFELNKGQDLIDLSESIACGLVQQVNDYQLCTNNYKCNARVNKSLNSYEAKKLKKYEKDLRRLYEEMSRSSKKLNDLNKKLRASSLDKAAPFLYYYILGLYELEQNPNSVTGRNLLIKAKDSLCSGLSAQEFSFLKRTVGVDDIDDLGNSLNSQIFKNR